MAPTTIIDPTSMLWGAWRYRFRHDRAEIAYLRKHLRPGDRHWRAQGRIHQA